MLKIFGHEIVNTLCDKIQSIDPLMFSVICDGTQDKAFWDFTRHHQQLVKQSNALYEMFYKIALTSCLPS
ncbi:hypothetical protein PR048_012118 [Dryococelus australis]|uniref:Uncharacterized protein n=1 Tax=Dryococelus australis TaxID=614101 RepID=A0ABQ9HNK3_9NEOP|nr:hypothetical protein PR048_012118 [Dryococelus australis]